MQTTRSGVEDSLRSAKWHRREYLKEVQGLFEIAALLPELQRVKFKAGDLAVTAGDLQEMAGKHGLTVD